MKKQMAPPSKGMGHRQPNETECKRVNIRKLLSNPVLRKELIVRSIMAIQAREGIDTTRKQAEAAYDAM